MRFYKLHAKKMEEIQMGIAEVKARAKKENTVIDEKLN
jgi:hypothetical protein